MNCTFHRVEAIKIKTIKAPNSGGIVWQKITIQDRDGEHEINCYPDIGQTISVSLHEGDVRR